MGASCAVCGREEAGPAGPRAGGRGCAREGVSPAAPTPPPGRGEGSDKSAVGALAAGKNGAPPPRGEEKAPTRAP